MVSSRRPFTVPVKIWFDPDTKSERALALARSQCILGETVDISRTGIGFLVSAIRYKEKYLVGHERPLNIEIDLPNGKVCLRAMGCRYKKVGVDVATERFLVGANIINIGSADKEIFDTFLRRGNRRMKSAGALELGID